MANLFLPALSPVAKALRGWPAPGVKPTGPVEIDWSQSITRNLDFCCPLQGSFVNLVTEQLFALDTGWSWSTRNGEVCLETDGSTKINLGDAPNPSRVVGDQTVLIVAQTDDTTTDSRLFGCRGAPGFGQIAIWYDTGGSGDSWSGLPYQYIQQALGDNDPTLYDASKPQKILVRAKWGQQGIYIDGVAGEQSTGTGETGSIEDWYLGGIGNLTPLFDGVIYSVYVWNRYLSDAEVAAVSSDPYCFFKPANQSPYLIGAPAAGGGGETKTVAVDIAAAATVAATPTKLGATKTAAVAITAASAVAVVPTKIGATKTVAAAISAASTVAVTPTKLGALKTATVSIAASSTVTVDTVATRTAEVSIAASSAVAITPTKVGATKTVAVAISASSTVTAAVQALGALKTVAVAIAASATVAVVPAAIRGVEVLISATSSAAIDAVKTAVAQVSIAAQSLVNVAVTSVGTKYVTVGVSGTSTVSITAFNTSDLWTPVSGTTDSWSAESAESSTWIEVT